MVLQNKGTLFDGVRSSHKCQLMPAVYAVIPLCHLCSHSVDNHMSAAPKSSHQLHDGVVYYHTGTKSIVLSLAWKCQPPTLIAITCLWQMSYTLMMSQSARTALAVFCSLVLPCTASTEQPARSSIRAYANVRSLSGNTLILQVTGTFRPCNYTLYCGSCI